jgi:hypothetical protein
MDCQYDWQRESEEYKNAIRESLSIENRPELIEEFKEKFEDKFPDFKYHSEYNGSENKFKMKCKKCGHVQERNAQVIRSSGSDEIICDNCRKIKKEQKLLNKIISLIKSEINKRREHIKPEVEALKRIVRNHRYYIKCQRCGENYFSNTSHSVHCDKCINELKEEKTKRRSEWEGKIIKCDECGKEFEMKRSNSRCCSTKCSKKYFYRKNNIDRHKKMKKNGKVNYRISKTKLIRKDNGICQLCGKPVDKNDYHRTDEGHFITGDNYPSIDHIIPVAKGGTHTWDNVQLAHFRCNSLKSDSLEFNNDQEEAS